MDEPGDAEDQPDGLAGEGDATPTADPDPVRVWLVERTFSDDELNIVILIYAKPDGTRYFRKERALTSLDDRRDTTAAVKADPSNLGPVDDPERRERYASEAQRMREAHDPDEVV